MFGGIFDPINDIGPNVPKPTQLSDPTLLRTVVGEGLMWMRWMSSTARLHAKLRRRPVCRAISMDGIIDWFREETWDTADEEGLSAIRLALTTAEPEFPLTNDSYFINCQLRKRMFVCPPEVNVEEEYDDGGRVYLRETMRSDHLFR